MTVKELQRVVDSTPYSCESSRLKSNTDDVDPLAWTKKFTVSKEEMDKIAGSRMAYHNLIAEAHSVAIVAPPNGGKTAILMEVCREMAADGYRVFYVNVDCNAEDAKRYTDMAEEAGFDMVLPDLKTGLSAKDIVIGLEKMTESPNDYPKTVFVLDTLKKFTNVINKSQASGLYRIFRALTAKSVTVIVLGHTNKYPGEDGKYVYEGTGDLRTDFDELIYMVPAKQSDGSLLVSTDPDKVRCQIEPVTFHISYPDLEVTLQKDHLDTLSMVKHERQKEADRIDISVIRGSMVGGSKTQSAIISQCNVQGLGR